PGNRLASPTERRPRRRSRHGLQAASQAMPQLEKGADVELLDRLDAARERWNLLEHPFYRRWSCGELTRDELAYYAGEYRHAVVALAETAAKAGNPEHAREEAEHVDLWDDFAAALQADTARGPSPETAECVS